MAEASKQKVVKSPQEIEKGIKSIQTVTCDPFCILPKEIYTEIFKRLDSPFDKHNFLNAHVKFHALLKSKRTLFLSHQVFQEIGKIISDSDENELNITRKDFLIYRLVCHDWDKSIQNYFQLHGSNFTLSDSWHDHVPPLPSSVSLRKNVWRPNKLNWYTVEKLENDMEMFSTHPPSRNPFLSRTIFLYPAFVVGSTDEEMWLYRTKMDTFLEKYGRHIWHCKIFIFNYLKLDVTLQIVKWLRLMPELKTLEIDFMVYSWHAFNESYKAEIENMNMPQLEMTKLVVLDSKYLPPVVFNKLFGSLKGLEKIQIQFMNCQDSFLKDYVMPDIRERLKVAFFTVNGKEDFEYLGKVAPFGNLKTLVISLRFGGKKKGERLVYSKWPEWIMIWASLEKAFPALEDLTLTLPQAISFGDKRKASIQSLECRLNLRNLKRLWISIPTLASIDFLLPCKSLEKLEVILCHHKFGTWEWASVGKRENLKFNTDLSTLYESNIWDEFPKLRILEIKAIRSYGVVDFYRYEKTAENKKYQLSSYSCSYTKYLNL